MNIFGNISGKSWKYFWEYLCSSTGEERHTFLGFIHDVGET